MRNYIIYSFVLCLLGAAGCSTDDIPTYGGDNYVQIKKTQDTVTMAFFLFSGTDQYDYPIEVEMSGLASNPGKEYKLVVDTKNSTAVENTHYQLTGETRFEAGEVTGKSFVRFIRTSDMKTEQYTLVLRVEDNGNYLAGQEDKRFIAIKVHDQIAQPEWWDNTVVYDFLGMYTDKKFETFLMVNNYPDLSEIKGNYGTIRAYSLALRRYLDGQEAAGNTVYEANGNKMFVMVYN